jgi:hypothetical protein
MSLSVAWLLLALAAPTARFSCSALVPLLALAVSAAAGSDRCGPGACTGDLPCSGGLCLVRAKGYSPSTVPGGREEALERQDTGPQLCCRKGIEERIRGKCKEYDKFQYNVSGRPLRVRLDLRVWKVSRVVLAEHHFTAHLQLQLTWVDPQLALCSCGGADLATTRVWLPDIDIRQMRSKKGILGRRGAKQRVRLRRAGGDGGVTVTYDQEVRVELACPFITTYFPFDRNKCMVRIGSFSYNESQVVMELGAARMPARPRHPDFLLRLQPLRAKDRVVERVAAGGETRTYIYGGLQLLVERGGELVWRVLLPYSVSPALLVLVSVFGLVFFTGRPVPGLGVDYLDAVAVCLLGIMFILTEATNSTPDDLHPVINFIHGCIAAIASCYAVSWIFGSVEQGRIAYIATVLLAALITGVFVAWATIYFIVTKNQADVKMPCHNFLHFK